MIQLSYGNWQRFRYRHSEINILGRSDVTLPAVCSEYRLNGGPAVNFYLERPTEDLPQAKYPYGASTPAVNRLRGRPGHFNIEIPADHPQLKAGVNALHILVRGAQGDEASLEAAFDWDPRPISLPLEPKNLKGFEHIQDIGQAVNGVFEGDRVDGTFWARAPVGADSLFLLGSQHGSQEAIYDVRFGETPEAWSFIGLSDFFGGNEEQSPSLGIKPGYTTAGLATIDNKGHAKAWLSWGDCLIGNPRTWIVKTEKVVKVAVKPDVLYRVRHQAIMQDGLNVVRFRIWRTGESEPQVWLCSENNLHLAKKYPPIETASFGLFQFGGQPTVWSNIHLRALNLNTADLRVKKRRSDLLVRTWGRAHRLLSKVIGN